MLDKYRLYGDEPGDKEIEAQFRTFGPIQILRLKSYHLGLTRPGPIWTSPVKNYYHLNEKEKFLGASYGFFKMKHGWQFRQLFEGHYLYKSIMKGFKVEGRIFYLKHKSEHLS